MEGKSTTRQPSVRAVSSFGTLNDRQMSRRDAFVNAIERTTGLLTSTEEAPIREAIALIKARSVEYVAACKALIKWYGTNGGVQEAATLEDERRSL